MAERVAIQGVAVMDFFERLRERARASLGKYLLAREEEIINATIEALKETMVGEPIKALGGSQGTDSAGEYNIIIIRPTASVRSPCTFVISGHHGLSGEEVVVMVFRGE